MGNAIKFTESGSINVTIQSYPCMPSLSESSTSCLHVTIEDTGVGINPEEIPELFTAFTQASSARSAPEGTGLGLYIVKTFVNLMGGEIEVQSQPGQGTIISFFVRVQNIKPDEAKPEQTAPYNSQHRITSEKDLTQYRILIVDDNGLNRRVLVDMLSPYGFQLQEAKGGEEALEIFDQWHPQLIFMDIRMPSMTGEQVAKHIKSSPQGKETVIVAVTASPLIEMKTHLLENDFVEVVGKPFQYKRIIKILNQYLGCAIELFE